MDIQETLVPIRFIKVLELLIRITRLNNYYKLRTLTLFASQGPWSLEKDIFIRKINFLLISLSNLLRSTREMNLKSDYFETRVLYCINWSVFLDAIFNSKFALTLRDAKGKFSLVCKSKGWFY